MPQPASLSIHLSSPQATTDLAHAIADMARAGQCVLLDGPVGAGKTFLARAVLQHLMAATGHVEDIPSPTFTLVQTYDIGALEVWHADLYRLTSPDELVELGLDAAFETAFCLIEWPDRMGTLAPSDALHLMLTPNSQSDTARDAVISGPGELLAPFAQKASL